MKKVLSYILIAAFACTLVFAFGTTAFAKDSVSWSAQFSPASMTSGGTVTFSTKVTCNGDPIKNPTIVYPNGQTYVLASSLGTGESAERVDENFKIDSSDLGVAQQFELTYTGNDGVERTQTGEATVAKKSGTVSVTGSASANSTKVESGSKVTFNFTFKNNGDVTITNAKLKAPPIDDGATIGQAFTLDPGDTKKMTYTTTVVKAMEVKPSLTFTADGESKTLTLDTISVQLKGENDSEETSQSSAIKLQVTSDVTQMAKGETVTFTAKITNSVSDTLSNLKLQDKNGKNITLKSTTLDAVESTTATATATLDETTSFQFQVTAEDSDGKQVKASSNTITITVGEADDGTPKGLTIDVLSDVTELEKPGEAKFTVTLVNTSDKTLTNVKVTENTIGEIGTLATMGKESKTLEKTVQVDRSTDYVFTVEATLEDGSTVSVSTDPISISVKSSGLSMMMILLIVVIAAIIAVVIILLVLKKKGKLGSSGNKERAAAPAHRTNAERTAQPRRRQSMNMEAAPARQRRMPENLEIEDVDDRPVQKKPVHHPAPEQTKQPQTSTRRSIGVSESPVRKNHPNKFGDRNNF